MDPETKEITRGKIMNLLYDHNRHSFNNNKTAALILDVLPSDNKNKLSEAHQLINSFMPYIHNVAGMDYALLNNWLVWAERNLPKLEESK